ncbi:MAG: hypothetical protein WEC33_08940 [Dehalococcoidia bacterium]
MTRTSISVLFLIIAALAAAFYWQASTADAQAPYTLTLTPQDESIQVGEQGWVSIRIEGPDPESVNVIASVVGADEYGQLAANLLSPNVAEGGIQFVRSNPGSVVISVSTNVGISATSTVQVVAPPTAETQGDRVGPSETANPRPPATGTGLETPAGKAWPILAMVIGALMVTVGLPLLVWRQGKQSVELEAVRIRVDSVASRPAAPPGRTSYWPDSDR